MIEGQLDGANRSFVGTQVVQTLFEVARVLSGQFASVQFFDSLVDLLGEKLALMKDNEPGPGRPRGLNEQPIVRILVAIPIHRRRVFERAGVAVKYGQPR